MKLLFADETGDNKFKDYFGVCVAVIDSSKYSLIKKNFNETLKRYGWDPSIELKGAHLFSESKGDPSVDVPTRIDMTYNLLRLNVSKKNARMSFFYVATRTDPGQTNDVYLDAIESLIRKALKAKRSSSGGKDVVAVTLDQLSGLDKRAVRETVSSVVTDRGFLLFEDVIYAESRMETVGTIYADIVAYLVSRIDVIENDAALFADDGTIDPTNGKWRKLQSSRRLIEVVKSMIRVELNTK